ncbi:MAG: Nucleotide sugar epimerase [uncultured Rubrobacteraceae bacterium]|uniref:Nucleotide sugar epimerase n=1 Tax=uncultured Rubrobacteraceae bacterium TaxID=349277 RepID=A0A6J4RYE6_9ACTN|nr:MAG: Nucleotide sugar epimerase [uncultured Rubrobacteraceae bacterium]
MSRVLVTGAAGFIGSHLVDRLLAGGREVVGVDAFTGYYSRRTKEGNLQGALGHERFRLVEGDLLDLDLDALLDGVGSVAHLAGEPGVRRSWGPNFPRYVARNVHTTERLLEAAARAGGTRLVYASSSSVYGSDPGRPVGEDHPRAPASPYALSKLAAEELVGLYGRERGVAGTVLRYFTVYGPRQRPEMALSRFLFAALRGRPVDVFGDGGQRRDMTYVADAVEATVAALGAPAGVYNVGGGNRASVGEMIEAVKRVTGTDFEVRHGAEAQGDVRSTWADSGRAERVLGYRPRVGLEEGVAAQARWAARALVAAPA